MLTAAEMDSVAAILGPGEDRDGGEMGQYIARFLAGMVRLRLPLDIRNAVMRALQMACRESPGYADSFVDPDRNLLEFDDWCRLQYDRHIGAHRTLPPEKPLFWGEGLLGNAGLPNFVFSRLGPSRQRELLRAIAEYIGEPYP